MRMRMRLSERVLVVAILSFAALLYGAVPEDFDFTMEPPSVEVSAEGGVVHFEILITTRIDETQGWSMGAILETDPDVTASITALGMGIMIETINEGAPAEFQAFNYYAAGDLQNVIGSCSLADDPCVGINAGAFAYGLTIDILTLVTLDASPDGIVFADGTIEASGVEGQEARLVFSDDVGDPAIATVAVHGGFSIAPGVQQGLSIGFFPCIEGSQFTAEITGGEGDTGDVLPSTVTLNFDADSAHPLTEDVQGWSYGICIQDPTKLTIVDATTDGTMTGTANEGAPPDFNVITLYENGVSHGVSISLTPPIIAITPQNDWTDMIVNYEILMEEDDDFVFVTPCNEALGAPGVRNVMSITGQSVQMSPYEGTDPLTDCCDIESCNIPGKFAFLGGAAFVPGSANGDGYLDLSDAPFILTYLFGDGPVPPCLKAADANGDCTVDSTDALHILWYLFVEGDPPAFGVGCQFVRSSTCRELSCEIPECEAEPR